MRLPATPPRLIMPGSSDNAEKTQSRISEIVNLLPTDIGKDRDGEYLHWDKMRRKPLPDGVDTHEDWWMLTKFRRTSAYRKLPFKDKKGAPFVYWLTDPVYQYLHQVDQQASGRVELPEDITNDRTRNRYLVSSLIEEAITSSQLEGASTTYKVAKAMLRENRQPRDTSERMIFNNYRAMSYVREVAEEKLSKELLFELHKQVTDGTLEDPASAGRFRKADEKIGVYDNRDQTLLHDPPHASELEDRLTAICDFANSTSKSSGFLHPVVRSILLHFMLAYDHPFVDGNGRTARALFYWSMAKQGYWLMEYISISSIVKNAPAKYARAYLYSENDDNDVTYFVDYNLRVILRAIDRLREYLIKKSSEIQRVELSLGNTMFSRQLNYRQLAMISHAMRNPGETYTIESHRNSHNVSYPTARSDLQKLVELGLLIQRKFGNTFVFRAADDIENRIETLKSQAQ